jgi:hypothetical protein
LEESRKQVEENLIKPELKRIMEAAGVNWPSELITSEWSGLAEPLVPALMDQKIQDELIKHLMVPHRVLVGEGVRIAEIEPEPDVTVDAK